MAWSKKKITLVVGGAVVGGTICFLTAGAAAPAVGSMIGSFMGLSGAAATNAGLAALGGGAIAAGGGGMAAGAALITTSLASAGTILGALGMGTLANFFKDSNKEFEDALYVQKDLSKARYILTQQEQKIRELKKSLSAEKRRSSSNQTKIEQLTEAIQKLSTYFEANKERLNKVS